MDTAGRFLQTRAMVRLLLWDVDGTLLSSGPAGREAIMRAVAAVLGAEPPIGVDMGGKTDPQIASELLRSGGMEDDEIAAVLGDVLDEIEQNLRGAETDIARRGHLKPGVAALLPVLAERGDVLQSVLTGNLAGNAAVKLGAFGLDRWLDLEIGAYGSDRADRTELVPVALERAARLRRRRFAPRDVWVIGDTANDLACARAAGVRCLIAGTGVHGHGAVADLAADAVLEDLSDTAQVLAILAG